VEAYLCIHEYGNTYIGLIKSCENLSSVYIFWNMV